ncbi:MAG: ThuA domain-containing protein [Clostridia bacterium]|nr:ThuA domain-containing protein [Clostridia bacterium]
MIRVTIFNEFKHEKEDERVKAIYPDGIHNALKKGLEDEEITVKTVTLDDEECGLTKEALDNTDVLMWWGHMAHDKVPDEVALRVRDAVHEGMGAVFLHSGHHSKPFKLLMGTSCNLTWREDGDYELVWVTKPSHPIAQGIGRFIKLEHEETYGEPFAIPEPEETVFIGSFENGEVFRAGCCFKRENGRIFYFQPGHETFPTYYNEDVIKTLKNAVHWANPVYRTKIDCPHVGKPLE